MPQLFPRPANTLFRVALALLALLVLGVGWVGCSVFASSTVTRVGMPVEQPIPFSHQHHVGSLGLDCRYCHATVETASFAGMPSTHTCITCHSQIWNDSPMLAPVRDSLASGQPLVWERVQHLPEYVYFDHRAHVAKGVACNRCHGRLDQMPLTWKAETLRMNFCLECHRHPERYVGSRADVFSPLATPSGDRRIAQAYHLDSRRLTDCAVCHR